MTTQANRQGRPWQRADGRWATRAYVDGKPRTVYGKTEDEALARQHEAETGNQAEPANLVADPQQSPDQRNARPPKPEKWATRISMTTNPGMKRDLELARLDDGIEVTARLRAMITLWQEDPKLRARIDRRARDLR